MEAMRPVAWDGGAITSLSLHRRSKLAARLDIWPFAILYSAWGALAVSSYSPDTFWLMTALVVLCLLHLLLLLAQQWSVKVRATVGFSKLASASRQVLVAEMKELIICVHPRTHRGTPEMLTVQIEKRTGRVFFEFQRRSYEYCKDTGVFQKVRYPKNQPLAEYATGQGLNEEQARNGLNRFGANLLEIPMPEFWDLFKKNLLSPFFVFQVFSIALWMLDEYWKYSLMTLALMLFSEAMVVKGRQRSLRELRGMRNKISNVAVFRNRKWVQLSSLELIPGDIISVTRSVSPDVVVPCDVVVLAGSVVVNEAMLTGESVPLMKDPIDVAAEPTAKLDCKSNHKAHIIFGGTNILTHTPGGITNQTPPSKAPDNGCVCYVLRTGFGSSQGKLMRTIMFSTEKVSSDAKDAWYLILFLLAFAIVASAYVLKRGMEEGIQSRYKLLLHCIQIVTYVVPPELPMQLALAVNASLLSLVKTGVFCTEPYRIPLAGKVDVCCFDKTGTLTTDEIKAVGITCASVSEPHLGSVKEAPVDAAMVLAGCHSLVHVQNDLVGDPLELEGLSAVGWTFRKDGTAAAPTGGRRNKIKIIQRNRFMSVLQRMSVIAQADIEGKGSVPRLLAKGSAEVIKDLLKSVPEGYDETATALARKGMRVLALAYREDFGKCGTSMTQIRELPRSEIEQELIFSAFISFECPLRSDSAKAMKMLRNSSHSVCMITGDATLTAAHVARKAGMTTKPVVVLQSTDTGLEWVSAQTGQRKKTFCASEVPMIAKDFALCVSGASLSKAVDQDAHAWECVPHITVFARMSPDLKERVLLELRNCGLFTLMCGDGTNDVGALKQADVGVALLSAPAEPVDTKPQLTADRKKRQQQNSAASGESSLDKKKHQKTPDKSDKDSDGASSTTPESSDDPEQILRDRIEELKNSLDEDENTMVRLGDASVAAPFTSKAMSIDSCVKVIRQGRCAQATALQMYQILALNSLVQAYSLSVLHLDGVKYGEYQLTIVGMAMTAAYFMISRSNPIRVLSKERPARSIFEPSLFLSLLGQFAVHMWSLMTTVSASKHFLPKDFLTDVDGTFSPNILNTVVFLIGTAQQVVVFAVNFRGRPFMEGLAENKWLKRTLTFVFLIVVLTLSEKFPDLNEFMEMTPFPNADLQWKVGVSILIDCVACFSWDRLMRLLFETKTSRVSH